MQWNTIELAATLKCWIAYECFAALTVSDKKRTVGGGGGYQAAKMNSRAENGLCARLV